MYIMLNQHRFNSVAFLVAASKSHMLRVNSYPLQALGFRLWHLGMTA